jgi:hypothetical protein
MVNLKGILKEFRNDQAFGRIGFRRNLHRCEGWCARYFTPIYEYNIDWNNWDYLYLFVNK